MQIFGWMMMIVLALFGLFVVGILIGPFVVAKIKSFKFRIEKFVEDEKIDIEEKSEARKNRQETKRQKEFELANLKLDSKIEKVDKQINLYKKKLMMVQDLKESKILEKQNLVNENVVNEEVATDTSIENMLNEINNIEELEQEK